jgi:hypothetical protein
MIVPDHPTGRWSVRCLGTWAAGHGGPQILALQTRMAPTATKAVNPLTEKPKRVGTPSPTSPTTAWAATALRRQVADSPHRKATRPLTTLGGEEPHWVHLKTTNPVESTFATVRLRTRLTKGPGSKQAGLANS